MKGQLVIWALLAILFVTIAVWWLEDQPKAIIQTVSPPIDICNQVGGNPDPYCDPAYTGPPPYHDVVASPERIPER